jgi:hypothetical protein
MIRRKGGSISCNRYLVTGGPSGLIFRANLLLGNAKPALAEAAGINYGTAVNTGGSRLVPFV